MLRIPSDRARPTTHVGVLLTHNVESTRCAQFVLHAAFLHKWQLVQPIWRIVSARAASVDERGRRLSLPRASRHPELLTSLAASFHRDLQP
eukprot:6173511-Pleurochrysis_carterae.AAC.3